jgi:hypothetical protein
MTANASQVVVGSGGKVYVAPVGTAEPNTATEALNAAYLDLGYISEDGVSASFGVSVEDINAFQSLLPIRRVVTGRTADVSFTCRQWNADTFSLALGGGSFDVSGGSTYLFYPPANGDALAENAVIIEWNDGSKNYRLVIRRAVVTDAVETQIVRNAAADLPVTLSVLGSEATDAWYLITDDDAFDTGA